ncbi:uncharacterized protein LOC108864702 [Galendromus occidentalis]|uniref:Uncharacterized protein LOC108864702 n=1 Tax=Galendromus occidentalis TaxID=34638 RepID=A0AAJ7L794_9ACAR|nr:uncharacterized protein LOC108864702 [Galendromus occidentalis]
MPLNFVKSNRGKPLLCDEGYVYRKDRTINERTHWRCTVKTCFARVKTENDSIVGKPEHSHMPDPENIHVRQNLNQLHESAQRESWSRPMALISENLKAITSKAVMGRMPSTELLRQKVTEKGENFLFYDSGETEADRILVFATPENLNLLKKYDEWFVDGTFDVCPKLFDQLYTFHVGLPEKKSVPVMYCLLPSKTSATYRRLLDVVASALDGSLPRRVHVDFEIGMIKELERAFPGAEILGCMFHFHQCLWRRIQRDADLRRRYTADLDFALNVRMFPALSFVPTSDVLAVFNTLLQSKFVKENNYILTAFINYFESTWVGRERNAPLMKHEWWNTHNSVLNGIARTNNTVESWHSAFSKRAGGSNPHVLKFVEVLMTEQARTEFIVTNLLAQGPRAPRKRYRDRDGRLRALVCKYVDWNKLDYLEAVAHNITF